MKQFLVFGVAVMIAVSSALGGLGDNADRIEDLYGNIVGRHLRDDGTVSVRYHKDPYLYLVIFDKQQSVLETYSRVDGRELSPKEISKFLKANAGRATWNRENSSKGTRYERSDHKVEATYANVNGRPTLKVQPMPANSEKDLSR
jgi:hypothetical protein